MKSSRSNLVFALSTAGCFAAVQACSDPPTTAPPASGGSAGTGGAGGASGSSSGASGLAGAAGGGLAGAAGAAGVGGAAGSAGTAGAGGLGGTAGSGGVALEPTFLGVANIMHQNCGLPLCHGGSAEGQDLVFVDTSTLYDILMTRIVMPCNNSALVVPGNPDASALLKLPTWQCTDFVMPQGCIEDPCISQAELDTIRAWITAGAPR